MVEAGGRVAAATRASAVPETAVDRDGGLFRAFLAGPGRTLKDAFARLDGASGVQMIVRHPARRLFGARMVIPPAEGKGHWEFTQIGDDVYVVVGDLAYKAPRVELIPGDGLIQFYFKLSGDLKLEVSQTQAIRLNRPSLLVYFQPQGIEMKEWLAPSARERCIAINVRAEYLAAHFLNSPVHSPAQLRELLSDASDRFRHCQLPLNTRMFDLASRLVENPYTGPLALIHTEAITLELLCAAVAEFNSARQVPLEQYSEHDLRCLHAARAFLLKQLSPAPSIRDVARAAGMNETSLKRGFKSLYGETLFDFSVRSRMQQALTMLREHRLPVARVAEAVGYSHQTSFATAFRRHFGLSPKDARGLKVR